MWTPRPHDARRPDTVAIVNVGDTPLQAMSSWASLGLGEGARRAGEIWIGARLSRSENVQITLAGTPSLRFG